MKCENEKTHDCYQCKFRTNIPGSDHSRCVVMEKADKKNGGLLGFVVGVTGVLPNGIQIHPTGSANGWAIWPLNFDPVWIEKCEYYKPSTTEL